MVPIIMSTLVTGSGPGHWPAARALSTASMALLRSGAMTRSR